MLNQLGAMAAWVACRRMTPPYLKTMADGIEQALVLATG